MTDSFAQTLSALLDSGNLRHLPQMRHEGKYAYADGRRMLNLSSNDYLGLASDPDVSLMRDFLGRLGHAAADRQDVHAPVQEDFLLSSTSSRLLTGTFDVHSRVERALCRLSGREAALVLSSGYHMNIGILPAVSDSSTLILADKLVHASIIDGIRLSPAKTIRFRHQDMDQLEALVEKNRSSFSRIIIVTESIFSMDGDVADLRRLVDMKKKWNGVMLYVDEAHAVGVRGETGMGVAQEQGVIPDIDFLCGTFGKAVASVGAYILCDNEMRDFLVNRMRSLIFTTALPPVNMLWTLEVLENLASMSDRRKRLEANAAKIRSSIVSMGLQCPSASHIIPVMAGDSHRAAAMAAEMQEAGFYLLPVRTPTVPEGTARLRISLTAAVSGSETDALVSAISAVSAPPDMAPIQCP